MSNHPQLVIIFQAPLKEKHTEEETEGWDPAPFWLEMMTSEMKMTVWSGLRVSLPLCYTDTYTWFWSNLSNCVPYASGWYTGEGDTFPTRVDCSIHQISQALLTLRPFGKPVYVALRMEPRALYMLEKAIHQLSHISSPLRVPCLRPWAFVL